MRYKTKTFHYVILVLSSVGSLACVIKGDDTLALIFGIMLYIAIIQINENKKHRPTTSLGIIH